MSKLSFQNNVPPKFLNLDKRDYPQKAEITKNLKKLNIVQSRNFTD